MTRIVGGYLLNPNDLEEFIRKLVNDDVSFEEDYDDTAAQYRLLVQWLKRLPQEERIAAVQCELLLVSFCSAATDQTLFASYPDNKS